MKSNSKHTVSRYLLIVIFAAVIGLIVVAKAGYDLQYGARPLRRAIQRLVEDALSEEILSGNIQLNQRVRMIHDGDKLKFVHTEV